jgi:sirohydrochlorin ferrochelatase
MHDGITNDGAPRLLAVAHGTASAAGTATTARLISALSTARPDVAVGLCFLDVATPRLPEALDALTGPTVIVPILLSTGYHVQSDIPAAVADRADVTVARHLGPHPLLVDALVERLQPADAATPPASTVLVGAGSSRAEAAAELAATGRQLGRRLGRPVQVLTMTDDLAAILPALARPAEVATYLLAEGRFVATLRAAAAGMVAVADPIGVHPALVELVWRRYDEALDAVRDDAVGGGRGVR